MSGDNNSFVRKEMISERIPPAAERGLVKCCLLYTSDAADE